MRTTHTFILERDDGDCHFDILVGRDDVRVDVYQFGSNGGIEWQAMLTFEQLRELGIANSNLQKHT